MVEDLGLASRFRFHKLRLLQGFLAMRSFRETLRAAAVDGSPPGLRIAESATSGLQAQLVAYCRDRGVALVVLPSPAVLSSAAESRAEFQGGGDR